MVGMFAGLAGGVKSFGTPVHWLNLAFYQRLAKLRPACADWWSFTSAEFMGAPPQITDKLIQDAIVRAVQNVCRTMLRQVAGLVGNDLKPAPADSDRHFEIIGSVGFAGAASGMVYLCLTDDFANQATGEILGMSAAEVEMNGPEVLKDAIGEITNMTAGGFKNELCDLGLPCKLTLPTILRGHCLSVAAIKSAARHIFVFDCGGHRFAADIQLKVD
jgi:chemotaxis protein CheX